uniref:Uncharacterized protein n=1 Tax=Timema tahoe TaxID=61484 RepID=A0A7R9INW4_9NEOP|nr:unnamed protein product [Timema tahoe]
MSKKLYNPNKPEDLAEIHRLLEASDEEFRDENFENESDIDSEDNVEEREEGSETEQEGSMAISLCAPQSPKDVTVLQYVNDVRPDGYDLLFETSDGTLRQETGVLKNPGTDNEIWEVVGKYKWISPDGEEHIMDFVANEGGVGGPGLGIRGALVGK